MQSLLNALSDTFAELGHAKNDRIRKEQIRGWERQQRCDLVAFERTNVGDHARRRLQHEVWSGIHSEGEEDIETSARTVRFSERVCLVAAVCQNDIPTCQWLLRSDRKSKIHRRMNITGDGGSKVSSVKTHQSNSALSPIALPGLGSKSVIVGNIDTPVSRSSLIDSGLQTQHDGGNTDASDIQLEDDNGNSNLSRTVIPDNSTSQAHSLYESSNEWRKLRKDHSRKKADLDMSHAEWLVRNSITTQGLSTLHLAVVYNRLEAAQLLLQAGADINARDEAGWTPLMYATAHMRTDFVAMLLGRGADCLAMSFCEFRLAIEVLGTLLLSDGREDPEQRQQVIRILQMHMHERGVSSCAFARQQVQNQFENVLNDVIESKDITALSAPRTPEGDTLLHIAVWRDYQDSVARLLAAGAEINAQDMDGWTPAHVAVYIGSLPIVGLLVDNGADVSIETHDGDNIHDIAKSGGLNKQLVKWRRVRIDRTQRALGPNTIKPGLI